MLISAGELISQSWELYKPRILSFAKYVAGIVVLSLIFSMVPAFGVIIGRLLPNTGAQILVGLVSVVAFFSLLLLMFVLQMALIRYTQRVIDEKKALTFKEAFQEARPLVWSFFGGSVLSGLIVGIPFFILGFMVLGTVFQWHDMFSSSPTLWSVLSVLTIYSIFHFLFFAVRLAFVGYFVAIEKMKTVPAMKASMQLVQGHFGAVLWRFFAPGFVFYLALLLLNIPGIIIDEIIGAQVGEALAALWSILVSVAVSPLFIISMVLLFQSLKKQTSNA